MTTVYFTREFTGGILKGIRMHDSIAYPTVEACADFIKRGREGFKSQFGSPWRIVDASFQKYDRSVR